MSPKKFPAPYCWRVDEATASESMGEQRANHPISVNPKPEPVSDPAGIDRPNSNVASTPTSPRGGTKIAQVIELLQRGDGATLAELVAATGWLPHTTRAALTGLRKRGYAVRRACPRGICVKPPFFTHASMSRACLKVSH